MDKAKLELFRRRKQIQESSTREKQLIDVLRDEFKKIIDENEDERISEIQQECEHDVLIYLGKLKYLLHGAVESHCYRYYCPICSSYFRYDKQTRGNKVFKGKDEILEKLFDALLSGNLSEANRILCQNFNSIKEGNNIKGRENLIYYLEKFGYTLPDDTIVKKN